MTTFEIKSELHKLIDSIEDTEILKAIRLILKKQLKHKEDDFWNILPDKIKGSVEKGLLQADKGDLRDNKLVMNDIKEKYKIKK